MGYCITVIVSDLRIRADEREAALKAMNGMFDPEIMEKHAGSSTFCPGKDRIPHYSWVRTPENGEFSDLETALRAWRYEVTTDVETGDLLFRHFTGEKIGDDEFLFETLAPFIADGGSIRFAGEDGAQWRYDFAHGELKKTHTAAAFH